MESPLRITMLTTSFPRSSEDDASIFIRRIAEALSKHGAGGTIVVPFDQHEPMREKLGSFSIERYRYGMLRRGALAFGAGIMPNLRRRPSLLLQVPLFLLMMAWTALKKSQGANVVHAQWLASGAAALLVRMARGTPYIVSLLGEDAKLIRDRYVRPLATIILRNAAAITAVNPTVLEEAARLARLPPERCHFIPTGVDMPEVPDEKKLEVLTRYRLMDATPYLLSIGRVIPLKGVHRTIELLAEPPLSNAHLVVAGSLEDSDYVSSLRTLAQSRGCHERVHLIGRVAPHDVPALLKGASCFVSASSYEGRPNAVMEALAAGTIVACSDIRPHRDLIQDLSTGLLLDLDNIRESAQKLQGFLQDPVLSKQLKEKARASMASNSWDVCARSLLIAYSDIVSKDNAS